MENAWSAQICAITILPAFLSWELIQMCLTMCSYVSKEHAQIVAEKIIYDLCCIYLDLICDQFENSRCFVFFAVCCVFLSAYMDEAFIHFIFGSLNYHWKENFNNICYNFVCLGFILAIVPMSRLNSNLRRAIHFWTDKLIEVVWAGRALEACSSLEQITQQVVGRRAVLRARRQAREPIRDMSERASSQRCRIGSKSKSCHGRKDARFNCTN